MYDIPSLCIMDKLTGPMVPQTSAHMADAVAAGGKGPIPIAAAPAGVVNDTSSSKLKDEHISILELADIDLQDLFAYMDQDFEYREAELTKALEHKLEPQTYEQGDQAAGDTRGLEPERSNTSGSDIQGPGGEIVGDASQDMDDEYDELFEEPLPTKEPATPPLSTPPTPHGELSALSNTPVPSSRADLDLTTVMSNITTLKSAIISNHLLLTRFLHLQSAYRSLNTTLSNERRLHADDKATIARMQEELASSSYDSPLLQFQITQLKEEARKERAIRMQSDATILQYQENIQSLQSQLEKIKKEKSKLEAGEKRAVEAIKTTESLKTRVVGLMSENKNLLQQVESLKAQDGVQEKKKMKEEIVKLKDMVSRLEGNNIRLKAGRSILAGGEGNSAATIQSLLSTIQKSSTAPMVTPQSPLSEPPPSESPSNTAIKPPPPGPIYITDDDVVVMGTTNALQDFQIVSPTKKAHSTITATSNPPKHSMYSVGRASTTPTPGANCTEGEDNDAVVLGSLGQ